MKSDKQIANSVTALEQINAWNHYYALQQSLNLWGDITVPFLNLIDNYFNKGGIYLDVPCGDGRHLAYLHSRLSLVIGLDSSNNALDICRQRVTMAGWNNVLLLRGNLFDLPFVSNQFTGIFCCDVLGHLATPFGAIRELVRVLADDGVLIGNFFSVNDPCQALDEMVAIGDRQYLYRGNIYFRFYEADEVVAVIESAGLRLEKIVNERWCEPAHEGYREYEHEHESWVFVARA